MSTATADDLKEFRSQLERDERVRAAEAVVAEYPGWHLSHVGEHLVAKLVIEPLPGRTRYPTKHYASGRTPQRLAKELRAGVARIEHKHAAKKDNNKEGETE